MCVHVYVCVCLCAFACVVLWVRWNLQVPSPLLKLGLHCKCNDPLRNFWDLVIHITSPCCSCSPSAVLSTPHLLIFLRTTLSDRLMLVLMSAWSKQQSHLLRPFFGCMCERVCVCVCVLLCNSHPITHKVKHTRHTHTHAWHRKCSSCTEKVTLFGGQTHRQSNRKKVSSTFKLYFILFCFCNVCKDELLY